MLAQAIVCVRPFALPILTSHRSNPLLAPAQSGGSPHPITACLVPDPEQVYLQSHHLLRYSMKRWLPMDPSASSRLCLEWN